MELQVTYLDEENALLDCRIAEGQFADASKYIFALIAADAQRQLTSLVQAGNESPHRQSTDTVWSEIRSKAAARLDGRK